MPRGAAADFICQRWRGSVPMRRLFVRDLLVIGSLINVTASVLGLAALAAGAPGWLALGLHLAPLPYNLFLLLAVGRSSERSPATEWVAGLWFLVMLLV